MHRNPHISVRRPVLHPPAPARRPPRPPQADGSPLAGAALRLSGGPGTTTAGDGTYRLSAAPGNYEMTVSRLGYVSPFGFNGAFYYVRLGWQGL